MLHIGTVVAARIFLGSVLALVYAEQHPDRVSDGALGLGTGRRLETDLMTRGLGRVFPDAWKKFIETVSATEINRRRWAHRTDAPGHERTVVVHCRLRVARQRACKE